jgi:hypothetical protein
VGDPYKYRATTFHLPGTTPYTQTGYPAYRSPTNTAFYTQTTYPDLEKKQKRRKEDGREGEKGRGR